MSKRIAKTPCNGGIYRITCLANGKSYIGSSKRPFGKRWKSHRYDLGKGLHCNTHLQRSWDKYGKLSFEFHPLEPVQYVEDLIEREQVWIDIYQACDRVYGFNIAPKADRSCLSPETKLKLSAVLKGRKHSPEHRAKIAAANVGRKRTPESRAKSSAAMRGRKQLYASSPYVSRPYASRPYMVGKKRTPEQCANISAAMRGKKRTPETRAKIGAALSKRNAPTTSETRAKIGAATVERNPFLYRAVSPVGEVYENIANLSEFCKGFGISRQGMCKVIRNVVSHHKGWTCQKILK